MINLLLYFPTLRELVFGGWCALMLGKCNRDELGEPELVSLIPAHQSTISCIPIL